MTVYEIVVNPLYGSVSLSGDTVVYSPDQDYHGEDFFIYRAIIDGVPQKERRVCVTVTPAEPAPTPPVPKPIVVNYSIAYGRDPFVQTGLVFMRNGVETSRHLSEGSSQIQGVFYEGDTITIRQITFGSIFPWPPSSNANLSINVDGNSVYNQNRNAQQTELQSYASQVPYGTSEINVVSTGSSTATGYRTRTLYSHDNVSEGDVRIRIDDLTNNSMSINVQPQSGTSAFNFNLLDNSDFAKVTITNNLSVDKNMRVTGGNGYDKSSIVPAGTQWVLSDVPKGSVDVYPNN